MNAMRLYYIIYTIYSSKRMLQNKLLQKILNGFACANRRVNYSKVLHHYSWNCFLNSWCGQQCKQSLMGWTHEYTYTKSKLTRVQPGFNATHLWRLVRLEKYRVNTNQGRAWVSFDFAHAHSCVQPIKLCGIRKTAHACEKLTRVRLRLVFARAFGICQCEVWTKSGRTRVGLIPSQTRVSLCSVNWALACES